VSVRKEVESDESDVIMGWPAPRPLTPRSFGIVVGLRERSGSMDIVIIEIDLGKNSCSLAGMDALGRVVLRRRMRRSSLESFAKGLGRCMIAMEACCGAPHLGRVFAAQGMRFA
jgi:hypothetical protein